jgi:hypothetical protein
MSLTSNRSGNGERADRTGMISTVVCCAIPSQQLTTFAPEQNHEHVTKCFLSKHFVQSLQEMQVGTAVLLSQVI